MKLCTAAEMESIDAATFKKLEVLESSIIEVAGQSVARVIKSKFPIDNYDIVVLCGAGNNGADGFVAARSLLNSSSERISSINCICLSTIEKLSPECKLALKSWDNIGGTTVCCSDLSDDKLRDAINSSHLIIDAMCGTGFFGEPRAELKRILDSVSSCDKKNVVAVDLPSGICADTGKDLGNALNVDVSVTFQLPKRGHFLLDGLEARGELHVVDVGIWQGSEEYNLVDVNILLESDIRSILLGYRATLTDATSHKGSKGHVAVFGSKSAKLGALKLAGVASLRVGAGKTTLFVPEEIASRLGSEVTEVIADSYELDSIKTSGIRSAVVGPGFGLDDTSAEVCLELLYVLTKAGVPTVVDADAIRIVSQINSQKIDFSKSVFTPHTAEAAAALGVSVSDIESDRVAAVRAIAKLYNTTVILKGAGTLITAPGRPVSLLPIASGVLATAGSGDVLAGVIAGFLARGLRLEDAVACGAFLHARAGICFESTGVLAGGVFAHEIAMCCGQQLSDFINRDITKDGLVSKITANGVVFRAVN